MENIADVCCLLLADCLLGLLFSSEVGGGMFLRNVYDLPNNTAYVPEDSDLKSRSLYCIVLSSYVQKQTFCTEDLIEHTERFLVKVLYSMYTSVFN
jgi:hypothetical protein